MSVAGWTHTYGIHHLSIFRSSYRKLAWMGFSPTTTEFCSDDLTGWATRPWVQLTLRANFVQLIQFHLLLSVQISVQLWPSSVATFLLIRILYRYIYKYVSYLRIYLYQQKAKLAEKYIWKWNMKSFSTETLNFSFRKFLATYVLDLAKIIWTLQILSQLPNLYELCESCRNLSYW